MGSQLLELKWANHKSNMALELQELYLSDALLDVTIACGEFSLKAHKTVLSASSTFFRKLFIDNPCKHPILIMTDIDFEDLKTIVQFMYQGEIHISRGKLTQFLKTADRLKIKGLTSMESMDISPSEQPEIDVDLQYSDSVWERTNTQSKVQDAPEAENTCSSKKVTDSVQSDTNQGTVKLEQDSARRDNDDCMYWQSDCFDQTSATAVLPDCSLPSPPTVSQQLTVPSVSHQPSAHSISHQLSVQPVSHKPSSSASRQPSDSASLQQLDDPSVSHQLGVSLNSESERFTYSDSQNDDRPLIQEPEDVTGDIIPVNLYQSQDHSPISIPSSSKSFEIVESLSGQSSSQGGKADNEAFSVAREPYSFIGSITYIREENIYTHEGISNRKHGTSLWICRFCRKSFIKQDALENHLKLHTRTKEFICTVCHNRFSSKGNLQTHLRIHTGERPYVCKECNKRFTQLRTLQYHERTHTGEKPYECQYCHNRFRDRSALRIHERKHISL